MTIESKSSQELPSGDMPFVLDVIREEVSPGPVASRSQEPPSRAPQLVEEQKDRIEIPVPQLERVEEQKDENEILGPQRESFQEQQPESQPNVSQHRVDEQKDDIQESSSELECVGSQEVKIEPPAPQYANPPFECDEEQKLNVPGDTLVHVVDLMQQRVATGVHTHVNLEPVTAIEVESPMLDQPLISVIVEPFCTRFKRRINSFFSFNIFRLPDRVIANHEPVLDFLEEKREPPKINGDETFLVVCKDDGPRVVTMIYPLLDSMAQGFMLIRQMSNFRDHIPGNVSLPGIALITPIHGTIELYYRYTGLSMQPQFHFRGTWSSPQQVIGFLTKGLEGQALAAARLNISAQLAVAHRNAPGPGYAISYLGDLQAVYNTSLDDRTLTGERIFKRGCPPLRCVEKQMRALYSDNPGQNREAHANLLQLSRNRACTAVPWSLQEQELAREIALRLQVDPANSGVYVKSATAREAQFIRNCNRSLTILKDDYTYDRRASLLVRGESVQRRCNFSHLVSGLSQRMSANMQAYAPATHQDF